MRPLREYLYDAAALDILGCVGVPYAWAVGTPGTPWPPVQSDCSGFAQMVLVRGSQLRRTEPDRSAAGLADVCDPVKPQETKLYDLLFYGGHHVSHVMVAIGGGWVVGASGGGPNTHGDDSRAFVKLERWDYRGDCITGGRIKAAFRPSGRPDDWTP